MPAPESFLQRVADLTGFVDTELATITGLGVSTVYAYRAGTRREYLNGRQRQALLAAVRLYRDQLIEGYDALELLA